MTTLAQTPKKNRTVDNSPIATLQRSKFYARSPVSLDATTDRRDFFGAAAPAPAAPTAIRVSTPLENPQRAPQGGPSFLVEKSLTLFGFTVGALLTLLFGCDLAVGVPLFRASVLFDTVSVICGAVLLYLSWYVLRDQRRRGIW